MDIQSLKSQPRWVCYNEKKAPINPHNGKFADSTNPDTWGTYEEAVDAVNRYRECVGVGVVFTDRTDLDGVDSTLVGIDLDDCFVDGELHPYAQYLIIHADSYTETSPSGSGIHILGTGSVLKSFKGQLDGLKIEMYGTARYFTFTESRYGNSSTDINDVQHTLDYIHAEREKKQQQEALAKKSTATIDASTSRIVQDERERESGTLDRFYQNKVSVAIDMVRNAVQGEKHSKRYNAGYLLGGALQALRDRGYPTMSDDDAIDMLYRENVPEDNQRREIKAIEDGLEEGKKSPLIIREYTTRLAREFQQPRAPKSNRMVDEETGEVIEEQKEYFLTDVGNARRFADRYRGELYWVADRGYWVKWNGKYWEQAHNERVQLLAENLVVEIHESAVVSSSDGNKRVIDKTIAKWAMDTQSKARLTAMTDLAKAHLLIDQKQFDTHPNLVNLKNGVYDIITGKMQKHDPNLFLTMYADNTADFNKETPFFDDFLNTIFNNDKELVGYFMKMLGYSVTGYIDEHALFFLYGMGKNGKTTAANLLDDAFGNKDTKCSYAVNISIEALMENHVGEGATPQLAQLVGKRFAFANELPENRYWNEPTIKSATGGDKIVARELYKPPFEFFPTHKFWVIGNHLPKVRGSDNGIRRRIKYIPFTTTIPEEKLIPTSEIKQRFGAEMSGIVAKILRASTEWFNNRLGKCSAVDSATTEYLDSQDIYQQFISDCLVYDERFDELEQYKKGGKIVFGSGNLVQSQFVKISKSLVFKIFQEWAQEVGETKRAKDVGQIKLTNEFSRKGICSGGQGEKYYIGVKLSPEKTARYNQLIVAESSDGGQVQKGFQPVRNYVVSVEDSGY